MKAKKSYGGGMNATRKNKSLIIAILLLSAALFAWVCGASATQPAYADMGPKPSVIVTVKNLDGKTCYGTLLSYYKSLGPTSAYDPERDSYIPVKYDPESEYFSPEDYAVWKAFVDYADPDGFYYQQTHWACNETDGISWTYYPPYKFKVLLYFPETQTFASSGVYERYAFHSYFTATLSDKDISVSQSATLKVRQSYDYTWEVISLLVRIIVTVLIELGAAWLFGLRTKKKILSVLIVNAVTQTAMNIALNLLSFFQGAWALLWYIPIELAVFITEAVAYSIIFNRTQTKTVGETGGMNNPNYLSTGKCILYALVANILSFAAGFVLVMVIPGIF